MPTTIYDIADRLKISHSTVSRVLNNRGTNFISERTRNRVFEMSRELGYRPNLSARALVTGRTGNIAIWSSHITRPFYAQVVAAIESLLSANDYKMILRPGYDLPAGPSWLDALQTMSADGIIAVDVYHSARRDGLGDHVKLSQPCVFAGVYQPEFADYVRVDLRDAAMQAVETMVSAGCRSIAFVASNRHVEIREQRQLAYLSVMEAAGLAPSYIRLNDSDRAAAREGVEQYLKDNYLPDGIVCFNDEIAIGAYSAIRRAGMRVPEDVLIVGCDGIEDIEYLDTPLATIAQPIDAMCKLAWSFLERRIAEPDAPLQQITLKASLIVRESLMPRK